MVAPGKMLGTDSEGPLTGIPNYPCYGGEIENDK
jgi:hypothetical protein